MCIRDSTNLSRAVKSHDKNPHHNDAVNATKRYIYGKSSITDSFLGSETVKKRESARTDQREYTKQLIDCIAYCQVRGIGLRGADEGIDTKNPGKYRRVVNLLAKNNTQYKAQLEKRRSTKREWLSLLLQKDMAKAIVKVVLEEIVKEIGD